MPDHAISDDPAVQRQLDRLQTLSPGVDILGLDRIRALLGRLGNPERRLPPVFHVAGTNGKGSTCAFLRAAIEGEGLSAHVYSSPHLVRFNERIRVAGRLIEDVALAALLDEVLDIGGDLGASFFEVTTAAAFLHFSRVPADACILEVGLGGRLDATNVLDAPAVCGIAQLGVDHAAFLGETTEAIAAEKAGIAKWGVPLVTMAYAPGVAARVAAVADSRGAPVVARGADWDFAVREGALAYRDSRGAVSTPLPALPGPHQPRNLALAIAMLRHQQAIRISDAALAAAARTVQWPARMQRLGPGPLTDLLPPGTELWLDGGHNGAAAESVGAALAEIRGGRDVALVLGMLANKDPDALLEYLAPHTRRLIAVPVPGHAAQSTESLGAAARERGVPAIGAAASVPDALRLLADDAPPVVLVLGSLYLAGEVLRDNHEAPD